MHKISRRSFISTTAMSIFAGQASSIAARFDRRPNVIHFVTDDQAYGDGRIAIGRLKKAA